jgi:ribosomal protein S20
MVLDKLNTVYNSYNVWLTYGQYMRLSNSSKGHCKAINNTQKYRKHNAWLTSHIRTYRRHLWMKVEENDLKDQYGNYFNTAGDLAIMYPMIEMAGIKRIKFIEDILYLYNDMSPINDFKIKAEKQLEVASYIKQMRIYREIK